MQDERRRVFVAPDVNLADAKSIAAERDVSADRCAWLPRGTAVIVNIDALYRLLGYPADLAPEADHA